MDRPVFFNFSTSKEITRFTSYHIFPLISLNKLLLYIRSPYGIAPNLTAPAGLPIDGSNHEGTNHILLFTVFNPMYPITVVSSCPLSCDL